jgi:DNA-binding response OmpR family regulator
MVILCADDDQGIRSFITKLLKADGHTVLTAGDGEEALELSRTCPGPIDLLLTDVEMPKLNGLELCKTVAAERPGVKVLLMSGAPGRVDVLGLPLLQKPFSAEALKDSIGRIVGRTME